MLAGASLTAQGGQSARPVQPPPEAARPFRAPALNGNLMQSSVVLAGLDDESSLFQKLNVQAVTARGSLAQGFSARTITLEDGRTELPQLPPGDPLRRAYQAGGDGATLSAQTDNAGDAFFREGG